MAVLRIHDILGWIRIRILGSMPLTYGSGFGSGSWLRTLLFSTLTFKMPAKNLFFNTIFSAYYLLFEANFTSFFKDKKAKRVAKKQESRFFLLFLHDDRRIRIQSRIRIRIHTSDQWIRIRIQEAQKHVDPVDPDPDSDPDPQHCFIEAQGKVICRF